ncbi:MAG TPA: amidohydrolase family protein [Planctomycetota bacterium]|nr:amidohydrolase family protein [Planctomycetota bacterium]
MSIPMLLAAGLAALLPRPEDPPLAFVGVHVVPMDAERVLRDQTVIIAQGRIAALGPKDELAPPADAQVVEGQGYFLMPGLFDLHVHIQDEVELEILLAHGVTGVRELGGWLWHLEVRDRIARGALLGPAMAVGCQPVVDVADAAAARRVVDEHVDQGFDFLKIYDRISADGYRVLVERSRERGIRPCGHVPRNLDLEVVLASPPDSIDHAEELLYGYFLPELDEARIPDVARRMAESGTALVATLIAYDRIGRQVADLAASFRRGDLRWASALQRRNWGPERNRYRRFPRDSVPRLRRSLEFQQRFVRAFHEAGVRVLAGTDGGGNGVPFVVPGASLHDELELLAECGIPPFGVLSAATREAARFLRVEDEVGTVEPGKRADLVLVMGDPLLDVSNVQLVAGVVRAGRWLPQEDLHRRLESIAAQSIAEEEFLRVLATEGAQAAVDFSERWASEHGGAAPFRELTVNELGYERMAEGRAADATKLLELAVRHHPGSWNAHDSLGEARARLGDVEGAIRSYERSLELCPRNVEGARRLAELRAARGTAPGKGD